MFCHHCNTAFEIVPISEGKSKYCKKCGNLIYKKLNDSIIIYHPIETPAKVDDDLELRERIIREKEFRYKEQLERKQKEQEFRERLEQERIIKELAEQKRKQKENEEQERLFQLELAEQQRIQKEKDEQEKLLHAEQQREKEIKEQLLQQQLENEKQERVRLEKEFANREQKLREEKENAERERLTLAAEKSRLEREQKLLLEKEKETARINLPFENKQSKTILVQPASKQWKKYALPLIAGVLLTITFTYFKDKISSISKSIKTKTVLASTDTNISSSSQQLNLDTVLIEQLKTNLIGKEILSWKTIKPSEIKNLIILSANKNEEQTQYNVSVNLDDKIGTKAIAELNLNYNKIILDKIETTKITYKNIAPVYAWFSFKPIPDCSISVNTNNNPIQLKFCDDCSISKMVSTENSAQKIESATDIYIKSDTKYEAVVEFTYTPIHLNQ